MSLLNIIRSKCKERCKDHGYPEVFKSAKWVPRQLTEAHKQSLQEACSEFLEYCHSDKTFLQQITTGDETWVHHLSAAWLSG